MKFENTKQSPATDYKNQLRAFCKKAIQKKDADLYFVAVDTTFYYIGTTKYTNWKKDKKLFDAKKRATGTCKMVSTQDGYSIELTPDHSQGQLVKTNSLLFKEMKKAHSKYALSLSIADLAAPTLQEKQPNEIQSLLSSINDFVKHLGQGKFNTSENIHKSLVKLNQRYKLIQQNSAIPQKEKAILTTYINELRLVWSATKQFDHKLSLLESKIETFQKKDGALNLEEQKAIEKIDKALPVLIHKAGQALHIRS